MSESDSKAPPAGTAAPIDEAIRQTLAAMTEIVTHSFDKSMAYTNLIMLGGYGGVFTLWNYTREQMSAKASATVAILISVSLLTFISFEVYKMIVSTRAALKQRSLLVKAPSPEQFLTDLQNLKIELADNGLRYVMPIWTMSLVVAVSTVLVAAGLLFYSFFATLFSWPHWP